MVVRRLVSALMLASFAPLALGCGGSLGSNAASQVLKKPELPTDSEAKCSVRKSQSEPLIVEWPNASRGRLEATAKRGLVAIKYEGCELTQLTACTVKSAVGPYAYWPITRKQSHVAIKDADDLYASMPVGAVKLEGKLKTAGELDVAMTIVGRYEAPTHTVFRGDLEGDCDQATHVVAALTVGSFTFSAGADAEVGAGVTAGSAGAGGKSTAKRETLQSDGDESACAKASATDKGPPEGCGALIQIEVMTLTAGSRPAPAPPVVVAPPVPPPPTPGAADNTPPPPSTPPKKVPRCKAGLHVEDGKCIKNTKKKPPPPPPAGTAVASAVPTCTAMQRLVNNTCIDDTPPPPSEPINTAPLGPPPPVCNENERYDGTMCVALRGQREHTPNTYDTPPPVDQKAPNPWRTIFFYSGLTFGALGLGLGYVAYSAAGDATTACQSKATGCTQEGRDDRSKAIGLAVTADILFGLTIASAIGFFLTPAHVNVGVAPTKGGVAATTGWRF